MDQSNDVLMKRLERLERSNRRLKLLGMAALAVVGTMGAAQSLPHTFGTVSANLVIAKTIAIVDSNGKLRIAMAANADTDQAGMAVFQRNGVARAGFGIDPSNNAAAAFAEPSGINVASIVAHPDQSADITTFEPTGTNGTLAITSPGPNGFSGYFVYQPDGAQRAAVLSGAGGSFIHLLHPSGGIAVGMVEPVDGTRPAFNIFDLTNANRATIAANDPSTGDPFEIMRIVGADGNVRVSATGSGFGSNNGLVRTFDSSGVQNGLLGVP